MALFKCKMCGGDLEVNEGMTVCECEYCGTKQTLHKTNDEQIINAMNRANHFRRQCEFDRALEAYEKILQNSDDDAELYWSLVLCKYGIEYVDDPLSGKKIPTCHRMQYTSILDDADYHDALDKADDAQKSVYKEAVEAIANVQRCILEISNKEEPFDVFICYKETGDDGERTNDSVLAQDIYYGLTEKGFNVFFSRITLEGNLGTAYEAYIFAALNSAKVMVVVGTKTEYVNAVWTKNEWSRFLMLMQKDRAKLIIPSYKDMDPYDLPDALSIYQSQDMSKLGFMQDLIRGVTKVLEGAKDDKATSDSSFGGSSEMNYNISALTKRGNLALEDAEWDRAFEFFDQVLNIDPECAEAYLSQAFAKNHVVNAKQFIDSIIQRTAEVKPTSHTKKITTEQIRYCDSLLHESDLKITSVTYSKDIKVNFEHVTYAESRQEQLDKIIEYFESDKLLKKALRFAKDNTNDSVSKIKESVIPVIKDRLSQALVQDANAEAEVDQKLAEINAEMIRVTKDAIVQKEKKYSDFLKKYNENLLVGFTDDHIKRIFESFGDFKDAREYANKISEMINEKDAKLSALADEKCEIINNSFANLGIFEFKKRRELKKRLKQIDIEFKGLEELLKQN